MNKQLFINIVKGEEYKVCEIEVEKDNNLFHASFVNAAKGVKEIIAANNPNNKEQSVDMLNNIIAFCGERGQGKSSAMYSFSKYLRDAKDKRTVFEESMSGYQFHVLQGIDPTRLEKNENILTLVLSNMIIWFRRQWQTQQVTTLNKSLKNDILEKFQQAYNQILTIKSEKKSEELSFEEALDELIKLGDSTDLKSTLTELVALYLKFVCSENNSYLVIQIDDTDLNIKRAYEIMEDIRKYFTIPRVIVLMATKLEQLTKTVEQQFIIDFKEAKDRIDHYEFHSMASKYIDKLLPENRRIYLPNLSIKDNIRNVKVKYENGKKDELLIYGGENLQEQILNLIYAKTAVQFVNNKELLHPIVPKTMRELVNLIAVLMRMKDIESTLLKVANIDNQEICLDFARKLLNGSVKIHENCTIRDNLRSVSGRIANQECKEITEEEYKLIKAEVVAAKRYVSMDEKEVVNNLRLFESYIRNNWIENHISPAEAKELLDMAKSDDVYGQTLKMIKSKLRNETDVLDENAAKGEMAGIIRNSDKLTNKYGLGDVVDAMMTFNKYSLHSNKRNYAFAISVLLTIKMYYLACSVWQRDDNRVLLDFIGHNYISEGLAQKLFPKVSSSNANRAKFQLDRAEFEQACKAKFLDDSDITSEWLCSASGFSSIVYLGYKTNDYEYEPSISKNYAPFNTIYWNVSYYFLNAVKAALEKKSTVIFTYLNIEQLINNLTRQLAKPDPQKSKATLDNFYIPFLEKFKEYDEYLKLSTIIENDKGMIKLLDALLTGKEEKSLAASFDFNAYKVKQSAVKEKVVPNITKYMADLKEYCEQKNITLNEEKMNKIKNMLDQYPERGERKEKFEYKNSLYKAIEALISDIRGRE